ncbi:hypothetical protein KDX14_27840 [Burkholderia cenocepacia]|uniref:hypothetical protein n=1 Tax=Burkholderia cenocepacia TaxID=95486 RepID=UPI001B981CE2|nr:hypothetical protein [Burkholderia cenocepacia]MBR8073343.1 hypothetical protein [Burkholderia cenocepacia]
MLLVVQVRQLACRLLGLLAEQHTIEICAEPERCSLVCLGAERIEIEHADRALCRLLAGELRGGTGGRRGGILRSGLSDALRRPSERGVKLRIVVRHHCAS